MAKQKGETEADRRERALHARRSVAGPDLYRALKPVAERLRDQLRLGGGDTIGVYLTGAEASAILAAVDKAENGVKP